MPGDSCILTTKDFTILEIMRDGCFEDDPLTPLLERKIESALVVFREDIPVNVATLSSRVKFSIDGRDPDTRILSCEPMASKVEMFLAVTTLRGLSLLGLAERQTFLLVDHEGREERITLQEVQYQPEAARRTRDALANQSGATRGWCLRDQTLSTIQALHPLETKTEIFPPLRLAPQRGDIPSTQSHALLIDQEASMSKRSLPRRTISAGDHVRLQATARSLADQFHPLAAPLSKAIEQAERLNEDDTRENTVSLNRFVTYKISGSKRPEQRLLVHPEDQMWPPAEISVITPLGLTLLGLSAGECAPLIGACLQGLLWVEVIAVGPSATGGLARRPAFRCAASTRSLADNRR